MVVPFIHQICSFSLAQLLLKMWLVPGKLRWLKTILFLQDAITKRLVVDIFIQLKGRFERYTRDKQHCNTWGWYTFPDIA